MPPLLRHIPGNRSAVLFLAATWALVATASPPDLPTKRLDFRNGEPTVLVGLVVGSSEVRFSPRGRMRVHVRTPLDKTVEAPAQGEWRVRILDGKPGQSLQSLQLAELPFDDSEGFERARKEWQGRGLAVRATTVGAVYGISGKVIDNRKRLLLSSDRTDEAAAKRKQTELLQRFGVRTSLFAEVTRPASGVLELLDPSGNSTALGQDHLQAQTLDGAGFDVRHVEYGVGYDFHNFADRSYRGTLDFTVGPDGKLTLVNAVTLEELLKGLVPSEIFARAPVEALKSQAVTARGEILAKVGTKHLDAPFFLCSEQHCAVYKGRSGEAPSTNAAVDATRGEALFDSHGRLVDSVYSAVCGGHTESNENVWGGPPNPSLRGRPDLLEGTLAVSPSEDLKGFLASNLPSACQRSRFAQGSRYRWERRFTADEMNALLAPMKLGPLRSLAVVSRGVSGRATVVALGGELSATEVRGELNIRRLFKMLNSSMFLVYPEKDARGRPTAWRFEGGGWGHGVGMCQTGAIGRAEAGHSYRAILQHYFSGATVARIY